MIKYKHTAYGLLVDEVDKMVNFYRDTLGFKVTRQSDTFALMDNGGPLLLFFWQWKHLQKHLGIEAMKKVKHRTQSALRFDTPQEVDAAYEDLLAKGIEFVAQPANWEWNAYAAYFVDRDGYMWEIFCWLK